MENMIFTSRKGKQVIFDCFEDCEDDAFWTEICPTCHRKYRNILGNRCDNSGSGVGSCGIKGCNNTNASLYVDFLKSEVDFSGVNKTA